MTIRLRLALLFTAATMVLLVGGGYLFLHRLQIGLENSLDGTLSTRADGILSEIGPVSSAEIDRPALGHTKLGDVNGIFAQLLSPAGRLLDSSRGVASAPLISSAQAAAATRATVVGDISVNIHAAGEKGPETLRMLATSSSRSGPVIVVAVGRDVIDQAVHRATLQLLALGAIVLVLAGPGSWLLARSALRPVERMRRQVTELHARDGGAELVVPKSRDEIARLAQTFNGLLERLQAAVLRERAFVADAGHELRTPLSVLKGELELAQRPGRSREALAAAVEVAAEETERLVRLAEDLLILAGDSEAPHLRFRAFDLSALTAAAIRHAATRASARGVDIVLCTPGEVQTTGDPDRIRQAIDNLLSNAVRHSPDHSTITVTISVSADGSELTLTVHDQGQGFPTDFIPVAFDRFTRADNPRARSGGAPADQGGNGLGLAIVASVMATHGGAATAANDAEHHGLLTLRWPVAHSG